MGRRLQRDEKLRSIAVLAGIGHGQDAGTVVLSLQVFVTKFGSPQRAVPARAVKALKVSALDHEIGNDAMKLASAVSGAGNLGLGGFRGGAKVEEGLARFGTPFYV